MTRYTQHQLKSIISDGVAKDITDATLKTRAQIEKSEGGYTQIGFSAGVYGCNGIMLKGHKTGALYAAVGYVQAIYIF